MKGQEEEGGRSWGFYPALSGGYNRLLKGYDGYKNLGNVGFDFYIEKPRKNLFPQGHWDNALVRFSFEYFPLQVPEEIMGVTEDLYSINFGVLYRWCRFNVDNSVRWVPFGGGGVGYYQDRVTLDTPASGKVEGVHDYLGFNASLGVFSPTIFFHFPFRLVPEVRYHRLRVPDGTAIHMTYQVALVLWFGGGK